MSVERYIPVQKQQDNDTSDFIIFSLPALNITDAIFLQDGGRSVDLEPFTLLAKQASSGKWRAYADEAATDGTAIPQAIYLGPAIASADIVAGDVFDIPILVAGAWFDENRLIIENSKTLETIHATGTIHARTNRDILRTLYLIPRPTSTSSGGEN